MKTKEEVKKSMSQGVEELKRGRQDLPLAPGRGRGDRLLDSSTPESAEQSEDVYENKGSPQR